MKANKNKADKKKITSMVLRFGMSGGFIGGYLLGLVLVANQALEVISVNDPFKSEIVGLALIYPFLTGFLGIFFGLVPAMLTGYCVAMLDINRSAKGYAKLFAIGAMCSGVLYLSFIFMVIGGLSAVIIGKFALPKAVDIEEYIK